MLRRVDRVVLGRDQSLEDPDFRNQYPVVWDHLTQLAWEDGHVRKASTIGIFPEKGIIRVLFRDVDAGLMTWLAITRLTDLWPALEAVLGDTGADWRVDRRAPGQVATRVKESPAVLNGVDKPRRKR